MSADTETWTVHTHELVNDTWRLEAICGTDDEGRPIHMRVFEWPADRWVDTDDETGEVTFRDDPDDRAERRSEALAQITAEADADTQTDAPPPAPAQSFDSGEAL
jgi:hypothetical protein